MGCKVDLVVVVKEMMYVRGNDGECLFSSDEFFIS